MALSFSLGRLVFLRLLAACYLCAFLSAYVQWAGLFSCDGLEPVFAHLQRVEQTHGARQAILELPTLAWAHEHEWIGVDVDVWMEVLALTGAGTAFVTLLSGLDSAIAYLLMWILYSSIQAVGQNFLSFQWDLLLLEVGFIAILLGSVRPRLTSLWRQCQKTDDDAKPRGCSVLSSFLPTTTFDVHSIGLFLLRFLLFRLMFASGVVKILSDCRTWTTQLSALEYHYATQCLPTPLAWYFHQLPAFIQQLSVAVCLFVEIIGGLLLLVPTSLPVFGFVRRLAALMQISLQVLILLSGNYTFFNYLTIAMACVLVSDDEWRSLASLAMPWTWCTRSRKSVQPQAVSSEATSSVRNIELQPVGGSKKKPVVAAPAAASSSSSADPAPSSLLRRLLCWTITSAFKLAFVGALVWVFVQFYSIQSKDRVSNSNISHAKRPLVFSPWDALPALESLSVRDLPYAALLYLTYFSSGFTIHAKYTPTQVQRWLDQYLLFALEFAAVMGAATIAWSFVCVMRRAVLTSFDDAKRWNERDSGLGRRCCDRIQRFVALWFQLAKLALVSVGATILFASSLVQSTPQIAMLSLPLSRFVVEAHAHLAPYHVTNSYGLFRQMTGVGPDRKVIISGEEHTVTGVERPELMLEGSADGQTWHELAFRYKPSDDFNRGPRQVAPHQPRLDWQMWFAALGTHPPAWLVHLIWKLLEGQGDAKSAPAWDLMAIDPKLFNPARPPQFVRIQKKLLDFTRLPGADAGRTPRTEITKATSSNPLSVPRAWWREVSPASTFLGAVDDKNPSLQNFLASQGWVNVCAKMRARTIRTKGKAQKDKMFVEIPEDGSKPAPQPPVDPSKRMFPPHDRPLELSFYLALIEEHLPTPNTYGPYARQLKSLVAFAREHLHGASLTDWSLVQWQQSPLPRLVGTAIAVVYLADGLLRF